MFQVQFSNQSRHLEVGIIVPVFINGQVNLTPVLLSFSRKVHHGELLTVMREFLFSGAAPRKPGLGSVRDSHTAIGTQNVGTVRPPGIEEVAKQWGIEDVIAARFYWWESDTRLKRTLGTQNPDQIEVIRAFDVLFVPLNTGDSYLALICSKDPNEFNYHFRAQLDLICKMMGNVTCETTRDGALPGVDNDLIFWLVNAWLFQDGHLPNRMKIEDLSDARSTLRAAVSRYSQVGNGLDQNRIEFMVMLAQDGQDVSPAKIALRDLDRQISFDVELSIDGSFSLRKRSTKTSLPPTDEWTDLDDIMACTQIFARLTLPELVSNRTSDKSWLNNGRRKLHDKCRERALEILIGSLSGARDTLPGTGVCPTCRKPF